MYSIGEHVVHVTGGIGCIADIAEIDIAGANKGKKYYIINPNNNSGGKVYVPLDNDTTMRRVSTTEEIEKLLFDIPDIAELVVDNEKLREATYKEAVKSTDIRTWVSLLKCLCNRRTERLLEGKKVTSTDERYFKTVTENLSSEIAFSCNITKKEAMDRLLGKQ